MSAKYLFPLLGAVLIPSCLFGPDFTGATAPDLPVTWVNALPPSSDDASLQTWWDSFADPQLTHLISSGFANNPDMVNAALNIERAESLMRSARMGLLPTAAASFGGSNSGSYDTSTSHGSWNGSLSISWSPDIWGKTRRQVEMAHAAIGSATAAANATRTALAAGIASTYFEWISAKESLRIAKEQLAYQERTYNIAKKRHDVGMQSALDLAESRATIASTRAQIPAHEANIKTCENALATYLGTTVDKIKLTMPTPAVYNRIPRVPTNMPSELLRRRPDIIKAEHDLHEATANIGLNIADLFPSLSLTGSTRASAGSDFADYFRTAGWSLSGSFSQSSLQRLILREDLKRARIGEKTATQNYRKTVLAAFAEVEDRLINYAKLTNQLPEYQAARNASKEAAELSLRRYNAGNSDFLNVAAAERAWLNSELNLISTRQQVRIQLARLCTALGGGW
ncbi:MAG: TolC family protein [Akkermansia sp.]|nr:TolC family protein [Akkermansia sp.]